MQKNGDVITLNLDELGSLLSTAAQIAIEKHDTLGDYAAPGIAYEVLRDNGLI